MSQSRFFLRTLDRPELSGPDGPVTFPDPRAFALMVVLALAGDKGVREDALLLRLTPELTPALGRGALRDLVGVLRRVLGEDAIDRDESSVRLRPGLVRLDVSRADEPSPLAAGPRFLAGFALADSPEFVEWVDQERRCVVPLERKYTRRGALWLARAAAVVLLAAGVVWFVRSRLSAASRVPPGTTVVLADVENATGDSLFDHGLTLATTVAMEQSGHLGLLSRGRVREALSRAGLGERDSVLTLDRAREAAAREGVRFVIAPRIAVDGRGYRVSAVLLDAFTDRLVKEAAAPAESRAGVLPALDRVLRDIRATLGERTPEPSERAGPLPLVTTPSLEALRSYALGARAWREGDYALAEEFWHRALDQDSGFAMAYHSIARGKALGHDRDSARYYFAQAFARSSRLTEWERLRLEESWASDRGDRDSAVKIGRTIAERFPSAVSWYNYGTSLMQANRCPEAVSAFEQALARDSMSYNTHLNMATCSRRSDPQAAMGHYEKAAAIFPLIIQRGNQGYEFASLLYQLGLVDSAARHLNQMVAQPGMFDRTLGHRGLGFLALEQGRPAEAAEHFEATIEIGKQQRAMVSLIRAYLFLGMAQVLASDAAGADKSLDDMMAIMAGRSVVPQLLALAGWGLTRAGRVRDAETLLLRIRQLSNATPDDRAAEAFLVGAIALARGAPERADSIFAAGPGFVQPQLVNLLRILALERSGKSDSAASLRTVMARATIFGTEASVERLLQTRAVSARTPRDRR